MMAVRHEHPARVRSMALDTGTSLEAAALQTTRRTDRVKAVLLDLFAAHGPMTDDDLVDRYSERAAAFSTVPTVTPQSVRTRRHELVVAGLLHDTQAFGFSKLGNRATVWGPR
jgi:hypothetical protein